MIARPMTAAAVFVFAVLQLAGMPLSAQSRTDRGVADVVMLNGTVLTVDPLDRTVEGLAIRGRVIVALGSSSEMRSWVGPKTRVINLAGRTATPGLIDSHLHFAEAALDRLLNIDLTYPTVRQISDMRDSIAARARTAKKGKWILGAGWDEGKLDDRRMPSHFDIDSVSVEHPVWLEHTTGHYGLANREALARAGITAKTPNPPQGIIDRFPDGTPTGVLREKAQELVTAIIPDATAEQRVRANARFSKAVLAEGMTAIKEPGIERRQWRAYQTSRARGELGVRVFVLWSSGLTEAKAATLIKEVGAFTKPYEKMPDDHLISGGVKLFLDGSGGGRTAWVYDDWKKNGSETDTGNHGFPTADSLLFRKLVRMYHDAGFHIGTHAIGDHAIDWIVDSYAQAMAANPQPNRRHSIIHAVMPTAHAIDVMAELQRRFDAGYPESSPGFSWWIGDLYAGNFGAERMARTNPYHTFAAKGVQWAGASDHPVTPFAARYGIWSAVARETLLGRYGATPFGTAEAADVHDALKAYTIWGAHQLFLDAKVGSLEVGKLADIAVWDRNPYTIPTAQLKDMKCEMTLVDGRVVFRAAARAESAR
jgi:predicted amidohydrolase YtcJ